MFSIFANSFSSSSSLGKNSCKGGSKSLIVTGNSFINLNISTKSFFCIGNIFSNAFLLSFSLSENIISLTASIRSLSKNICSVLHKPIPSAPNSKAVFTSIGVSAFDLIFNDLIWSAHSINSEKSLESSGIIVGTSPLITSPKLPSMVITSPECTVTSPTENILFSWSIKISPAPATHALPIPLATTAAWLVMPPLLVNIPFAACIP